MSPFPLICGEIERVSLEEGGDLDAVVNEVEAEAEEGLVTTRQIRALWSALQVARWRTSGERSTRVM